MNTLAAAILPSSPADRRSQSPALETAAGTALSFGELQSLIDHLQSTIHPAIVSSTRHRSSAGPVVISISLPNSIEFVVAFLAVCNLGMAAAPLNPKYGHDEIKFYVDDASSRAIILPWNAHRQSHPAMEVARELQMIVWEVEFVPESKSIKIRQVSTRLKRAVKGRGSVSSLMPSLRVDPDLISPDSVALILHTSGTTSKPKCVPLTHRNICQTIGNVARTYKLTPADKSLVVMPLFHVHGLIGALLSTLATGGCAVVMPFSVKSFWLTFSERKCSWYSAVPTIHQLLLRNEPEVGKLQHKPGLRFIRSCSSALPAPVLKQLEATYGVPVLEAYAMTEASHQMTSNPLPPAPRKPGSVGIPQGVEMAILDDDDNHVHEGEVCIRGPNVTIGYMNRPEANKASFTNAGWFRTGDRGYFDKDGYLFLTGRLKELINRAGEKISPLEVDAVLLDYPGVAEAVSFAVPDATYGEEVHAAVVLREEGSVTQDQLKQHCKSKMAAFKCPKTIYMATDLPRTATGKIQRRIVASHFLNKSKL